MSSVDMKARNNVKSFSCEKTPEFKKEGHTFMSLQIVKHVKNGFSEVILTI